MEKLKTYICICSKYNCLFIPTCAYLTMKKFLEKTSDILIGLFSLFFLNVSLEPVQYRKMAILKKGFSGHDQYFYKISEKVDFYQREGVPWWETYPVEFFVDVLPLIKVHLFKGDNLNRYHCRKLREHEKNQYKYFLKWMVTQKIFVCL